MSNDQVAARGDDAPRIEVVFSAAEIQHRINALAREVAAAGADDLLVVAILKGSFVFAADLIRAMHASGLAPEVDFLSLASYGREKTSKGSVSIVRDLDLDVAGRNVLIVDDILESGRTLAFARDLVSERGAGRVQTCVLLDKAGKRAVAVDADYRAFECPDVFVVGYGMDLAYRYRELPFVGHVVNR
ncbi:MAG: hypoxanthine phosphoribosyltransferase [Hyphomicrobiaceae bacterium]